MKIKTYAVILAVGGKVAEIDTFSFDAEGLAEARGTFFRRCTEDLEMSPEDINDLGESFAYDDGNFSLILTETGNAENPLTKPEIKIQ